MTNLAKTVSGGIAVGDLNRAVVAYGQATLRAWRHALADLEEKQRGYVAPTERDDLALLVDHMRQAINAFDRAMTDGVPVSDRDPGQLDWFNITAEIARDEAAGWAVWQRVKDAAVDDLAAGRTAADCVEGPGSTPIERAQFLAQRAALADGMKPANGLEWTIVDAMAQAMVMHRRWLKQHVAMFETPARAIARDAERRGDWQPERLAEAEATDRAAMMADRFLRSFLRLHKAFRDNRRIFANVTVMDGGQVNVAQEQVVAAAPKPKRPRRTSRPAAAAQTIVVVDAEYRDADADSADE